MPIYDVDVSMNLTVKAKSKKEAEDIAEDLAIDYLTNGSFGVSEYLSFKATKVPNGEIRYQIDNLQDDLQD